MGKRKCCIERCHSDNSRFSLFLPPKRDVKTRQKWSEAIASRRKLTFQRDFVCELHFKPCEVLRYYFTHLKDGSVHKMPRARTSLMSGAYPTVFDIDYKKYGSSLRSRNASISTGNLSKFNKFVLSEARRASDEDAASNEGREGAVESGESKIVRNRQSSQSEDSGEEDGKRRLVIGSTRDGIAEIVWHSDDELADQPVSDSESPAASTSIVGRAVSNDEEKMSDDDPTIPETDDENADDGSTVKSAEVYFASSSVKCEPPSPDADNSDSQQSDDRIDLRSVLNSRSSGLDLDDEMFVRFCQRHVVTSLMKKGRMSFLNRELPELESENDDGLQVVHDVVGRYLKVDLLISWMDDMTYPSKSWFHTVKDGAPTFFCWTDGFRIDKTVILNAKNLEPTVIFVDKQVKIPEVVRPRSINDVQSILSLVDSAQECSRRNCPGFARACKGFLIPKRGISVARPLCSECALAEEHENKLSEEELTFDIVCRWAKEITKDTTTWSYTLLGTAVILIGWMKCYTVERLLIVNNDLSIKVMIGGKFVSTGLTLRNRQEFTLAIGFLEKCRKCFGIGKSRFASDCLGFVVVKDPRLRIPKCQPCQDAKRTEVSRIKPSKPAKVQVRKVGGDVQPLKLANSTEPRNRTSNQEINVIGVGETNTSKSVHLVDVLDCVSLPSDSWSSTVVDGSVVFQHTRDNRVDKKVLVLPNTVILIYAEENLIEIESGAVIEARSIFDVEQALILAENLHLCEGYGPSLRAGSCPGYFVNLKQKRTHRMCDRCSEAASLKSVQDC